MTATSEPAPLPKKGFSQTGLLLLLLALFVGARVLLALRSPIHLLNGEEYVHLRMFRQLADGFPLGEIGQYAYSDGRGINGGGSVVLSLLYLGLAPVLGTGELAIRTMALLWATGGALLAASLGRRLLGPQGGIACLLALLCMPPSYTIHSSLAWGNHAEGGVLVLMTLWLFLRALDARSSGPGLAWAGGLGLCLSFSTWFWPLAAIPALLLLIPALRRLPGGVGSRTVLALGLALGIAPWFLVEFNSSHVEHTGGLGSALASLGDTFLSPSAAWQALVTSFGAPPVYDVAWAGRWTPPSWLAGPGATLFRIVAWTCVFALVAPLARIGGSHALADDHDTPGTLAARWTIALSALLIPLALVTADAVAPRRMTSVYLLWALALAVPLRLLLRPGPAVLPRRVVLLVVVILGLAPTLLIALSGSAPSLAFDPSRYALCPAEQPLLGDGTCVRDLSEEHLPVLHRIDDDERLEDGGARKAALIGFDAATGTASNFALSRALAPCPEQAVRVPALGSGAEHDLIAWEYFGSALAVSCGSRDARERCSKEAPPELLEVCEAGVDQAPASAVP